MVAGNIIAENSRVKTDGTHQATEFSLMSFKLEDEPDARKVKKNEKLGMLRCHVLSQGGSTEMCGEPLIPEKGQHECKAIFWWYNIGQYLSNKTNVDYYPIGTETNAQNFIWDNYSICWTAELQGAVGANGDLSRESVKKIFNGDIKTLTPEMIKKNRKQDWSNQHHLGKEKSCNPRESATNSWH